MARKKEEKQEETPKKASPVELAISTLEKTFGKGIITSGATEFEDVDWFSSGCLGINKILSGRYDRGYPLGRIIEVYGPESSGKTTLCLHAIAEAQKAGYVAAFVDAEHALDPLYATNLGVDMDKLLISQPSSGEQALEVVESLVRSGAVKLIVVDSVAALVPRAELEGEMGDSHMGLQARLMSQAMRKLVGITYKTGCTIIFINQLRMKIGVMFGNPEITTGGNALKFYSSMRIDIRRIGGVKQGEEFIGAKTRVKLVKSKLSPPFKEVELQIKYGEGLDIYQNLLQIAVEKEIVDRSGSWYAYGERKLGQGENKVVQLLKEDSELTKELYEKVIA